MTPPPETPEERRSGFGASVVSYVQVLAVLLCASVIALRALFLYIAPRSVDWKLVWIHPVAATTAGMVLAGSLALGLLAWYGRAAHHQQRRGLAAVIAAVLFVSLVALGSIVLLIQPAGAVASMQTLVLDEGAASRPTMSVFFANGSAEPHAADLQAVKKALQTLRCGAGRPLFVRVHGFASSARFVRNSDESNVGLANRRADAVVNAIQDSKIAATTHAWGTAKEMFDARSFVDVVTGNHRSVEREQLNRRADVVICQ